MLNGVIILVISFICDVPSYYDVDEKFQSEQERVSYYSAKRCNNNNTSGNDTIIKTSSTKKSVSKTQPSRLPQSATSVATQNDRNSYSTRTAHDNNANEHDK